MAQCRQCGEVFEAKRSTAVYCSDKCRKLAFLKVSVPLSVPGCKRGKDIQCFADLPPDVQGEIERMAKWKEEVGANTYEAEKAARTATAIHYQHLFPNRYYPTGISGVTANVKVPDYKSSDELAPSQYNKVPLPGDADYVGVCHEVDGCWVVGGRAA